jgi:hypothetical protein
MAKRRDTRQVNGELIEQLMAFHKTHPKKLAGDAKVGIQTIHKMRRSERVQIAMIEKVASVFGKTVDDLTTKDVETKTEIIQNENHTFDMTIKIKGSLAEMRDAAGLAHAAEDMINMLSNKGIRVDSREVQAAIFTSQGTDLKRIIVLMYGILENGNPYWLFAGVRPSDYALFLAAQRENKLDLYNFSPYGEIIISGEGGSPPDEVTEKVAEMFQTDVNTLMGAMHEESQDPTFGRNISRGELLSIDLVPDPAGDTYHLRTIKPLPRYKQAMAIAAGFNPVGDRDTALDWRADKATCLEIGKDLNVLATLLDEKSERLGR